MFRSTEDHVVEPDSARLLLEKVSSTDVREVLLEDSYHVATLDNDAPTDLRRQPRVRPAADPGGAMTGSDR